MAWLVGEDFAELFTSFEHTAFRLETREHYGVADEVEPLRQFLAGEPVDLDWLQPWLDLMKQLTSSGRRVERVRVVSEPHSDYTRFGLWLCQHNIAAGEDIRYLPRSEAGGLPGYDFWLFDSRRLALMHFDDTGDFLGAEIIEDPAVVARHCHWRDKAWHHAVPYQAYLESRRSGERPAGA